MNRLSVGNFSMFFTTDGGATQALAYFRVDSDTTGGTDQDVRQLQMRKVQLFAIVSVLSVLPSAVMAATTTTTMAISATVLTSCTAAATPLAFGNYDPSAATATTATATITVTCTGNATADIALDKGANGTSTTARDMILTGGSALLSYALYQDSAHTLNWGDVVGTDTVSGSVTLATPLTKTVYGEIPVGQAKTAGAYTDTVNVTVTY